MKRRAFAIYLGLVLCLYSCSTSKTNKALANKELSTNLDSVAYAFGLINGANFSRLLQSVPGDSLSRSVILLGFSHQVEGRASHLSLEQAKGVFEHYLKELEDKENKRRISQNDSVLQVNKTKPGVIVTDSGLQYRILKQGNGSKTSSEQDTVVVHYKGRLWDGETFDSSYERNQPAQFPVGAVIPGWTEALQLMPVGSKYELYIPSNLGYGERGAGQAIPPYATLIFEVELLDIKPHQEHTDLNTTTSVNQNQSNKAKGNKSKR